MEKEIYIYIYFIFYIIILFIFLFLFFILNIYLFKNVSSFRMQDIFLESKI